MKKKVIYLDFRRKERLDPSSIRAMMVRFDSPADLVKFLHQVADEKGLQ